MAEAMEFSKGQVVLLLALPTWLQRRSEFGYCHVKRGMYGVVIGYCSDPLKVPVEFLHPVWGKKNDGSRSKYNNGCQGLGKVGHCAYVYKNDLALVRKEKPGFDYGEVLREEELPNYILDYMMAYELSEDDKDVMGHPAWAISQDHQNRYNLPCWRDRDFPVNSVVFPALFAEWLKGPRYEKNSPRSMRDDKNKRDAKQFIINMSAACPSIGKSLSLTPEQAPAQPLDNREDLLLLL